MPIFSYFRATKIHRIFDARTSPQTGVRGEVDPFPDSKDDQDARGAPLRLMTHFLKAMSDGRMVDALALAQSSES